MAILWDESKRIENLRVHKYDFRDAWKIFNGLEFTFEDDRFPYAERRYNTIGFVEGRIAKLTYCFDVLPALRDRDSCFQRRTSATENV